MDIKPTDRTIRDLLDSGFYKIPRFQRPYSWEKTHVEDLWADSITSDEESYFIGSFVVFPERKDSSTYMIVDGQQRLTTITILLAAVRNGFDEIGEEELAKGVQSLIETADLENEEHFILQSETGYPYLQECIQKHGPAQLTGDPGSEEQALKQSFELLSTKVSGLLAAVDVDTTIADKKKTTVKKERLTEVRDKLLRLQLITIQLPNEEDAYLIFETLNTRGKDLGIADLFKNHFTRKLRPKTKGVDVAKDKWHKIRATIDESAADLDINRFFYHSWISGHPYVGIGKVFREARKKITKPKAMAFLDDFVSDAGYYRIVLEPDSHKWKKEERPIAQALRSLNMFRVLQPAPLTLGLIRAYLEKDLTLRQTKQVFVALEKFHAQFTGVTSQRTGGGTARMYAASAQDLADAADKNARAQVLKAFIEKLKARVPSSEEFAANLGELVFLSDNTRDKPVVRYLLEKLDGHYRTGAAPDYVQMNIEHIAPENPRSGKGLPTEVVGSIGNLLLLPEDLNAKMGNKGFPTKKAAYVADSVPMDPVLAEAKSWSEKKVAARSEELAEVLHSKILKV